MTLCSLIAAETAAGSNIGTITCVPPRTSMPVIHIATSARWNIGAACSSDPPRLWKCAVAMRAHGRREQVVVAEHHALGITSGAAGVEHARQVAAAAVRVLGRQILGEQLLIVQRAAGLGPLAAENHRLQARRLLAQRRDRRRERIVDQQNAGIAVRQRIGDLGRAPPDVNRVDHRPGPRHPQQELVVAVRVQRQHAHPVARADPAERNAPASRATRSADSATVRTRPWYIVSGRSGSCCTNRCSA